MKTLYLVRHAKSAWANELQSDFERPLNDRGERDAPIMGLWMRKLGVLPDLILASAARRTTQTARLMAGGMQYPEAKIEYRKELYHSTPEVLQDVIGSVDGAVEKLMVIVHNPGITSLVNSLSDAFSTGNMPTCGVVGVRAESPDWQGFWAAEKEVFMFEYPKKNK